MTFLNTVSVISSDWNRSFISKNLHFLCGILGPEVSYFNNEISGRTLTTTNSSDLWTNLCLFLLVGISVDRLNGRWWWSWLWRLSEVCCGGIFDDYKIPPAKHATWKFILWGIIDEMHFGNSFHQFIEGGTVLRYFSSAPFRYLQTLQMLSTKSVCYILASNNAVSFRQGDQKVEIYCQNLNKLYCNSLSPLKDSSMQCSSVWLLAFVISTSARGCKKVMFCGSLHKQLL